MDPGTGLTVLGSAIGGAKLVEKLLGPTADYVGSGLKNWAEKRVQNTSRIFGKAAEKLGDKINEPGLISPRVLKEVLDEGSYCDDELTAEYFGGVLASSRTGASRDDRAAPYLKLTSELSTYQIRFHYIFYMTLRNLFVGSDLRPNFNEDLERMWIFLPLSFLNVAMDFTEDELPKDILLHCVTGLGRHGLTHDLYGGAAEHVSAMNKERGWPEVSEWGMCVGPTQNGIDYWLWAIGAGATSRALFLQQDLQLPKLPELSVPDGPIKMVTNGR